MWHSQQSMNAQAMCVLESGLVQVKNLAGHY